MRVTVVLPVKDGEAHLDAALDSLEAQERRADEVVAVDDGSLDGSAALLHARPWVTVVDGPRAGIAAAFATGVAAATGDALAFLSHDDVYLPGALGSLEAALETAPGAALAAGSVVLFSDGPDFSSLRHDRLGTPHAARVPESVLVRRDALATAGGIDLGARVAWDIAMFLALDEVGPTARTEAVIARKRLRADSAIHGSTVINAGMLGALRAAIVRRRDAAS